MFSRVEFDVFAKSNGGVNDQFNIKIREDSKEYDLRVSVRIF